MAPPRHEQRLHDDVLCLLVLVHARIEVGGLTGPRRQRRWVAAHDDGAHLEAGAEPVLQRGVIGTQEHAVAAPRSALRQDPGGQVVVAQLEVRCRLDGLIGAADVYSEPMTVAAKQSVGCALQLPREALAERDVPLHKRTAFFRLMTRDAAVALDHSAESAENNLVLVRLEKLSRVQRPLQHVGMHLKLRRLVEEGCPRIRLARGTAVQQVLPRPVADEGPTFLLASHAVPQSKREHGKEAVGVLATPNEDRRSGRGRCAELHGLLGKRELHFVHRRHASEACVHACRRRQVDRHLVVGRQAAADPDRGGGGKGGGRRRGGVKALRRRSLSIGLCVHQGCSHRCQGVGALRLQQRA
mmetsp:Transcript_7529/g.21536  ORF Transcript_7529/g.21536 Transcript_7529/m.21536 type:complete len:356 (-) Transcript_7529:1185-2252(-)